MEELISLALQMVPQEYHKKFFFSFEGGKRVRPLLMKGICTFMGEDFAPLRSAALAIEILHCSTLLHDDIIDDETERRKEKPFYKKYSVKQAILFGDYFALLGLNIFKKEYPSILPFALDSLRQIVEGQLMELAPLRTLNEYLTYAEKKTGSLFLLAAQTPCTFFGVEKQEALDFARSFGIAFQVANDLQKQGETHSILTVLKRKEAEDFLKEKISTLSENIMDARAFL